MTAKDGSSAGSIRRRDLLAAGLCLPLGLTAGASSQAAEVVPGNMKVSLAAYSMREALTSGEMDLFGFVDWCSEMDLSGAELTSYYFKEGFDGAYLRRLKNHAFRQGVTVSGTAIRNDFCMPPGPEKDRQIAAVKNWIDYAAELGAPHVRIFAGNVPDGADKAAAIRWTAEGIKAVLDHAGEKGVIVGLENHGGITAMARDHLDICEQVGRHPWFGVNLDTGNYRNQPYEELKLTAPWAVNVQVKVEVWKGEEKAPADLERIRDIISESGYKGWVVLEYEASEEPLKAIPGYVRQLKRLFESCA